MHRVVLELVAVASQCNHPLLINRTLWEIWILCLTSDRQKFAKNFISSFAAMAVFMMSESA